MEALPEAAASEARIQVDESVSFTNADGHKIVYKSWRAETEPRSVSKRTLAFCVYLVGPKRVVHFAE